MAPVEQFSADIKLRVMNLSRSELLHILQCCQVTNIETDDPLYRLNHKQLCDLVASNSVPRYLFKAVPIFSPLFPVSPCDFPCSASDTDLVSSDFYADLTP